MNTNAYGGVPSKQSYQGNILNTSSDVRQADKQYLGANNFQDKYLKTTASQDKPYKKETEADILRKENEGLRQKILEL